MIEAAIGFMIVSSNESLTGPETQEEGYEENPINTVKQRRLFIGPSGFFVEDTVRPRWVSPSYPRVLHACYSGFVSGFMGKVGHSFSVNTLVYGPDQRF